MTSTIDLKDAARTVWAAGDYGAIAPNIALVGLRAVRYAGVRAGEAVLDVACGTGNVALPAARAGARVTGLDLTPELLARARALAAADGLDVAFVEGDAEALPFPDASFDVVLSTFGVMFAPDAVQAGRELVRVLRPGGRMVLCNWTREGETGEMFGLLGAYEPPPPPGAGDPLRWGDEAFVRELLAPLDVSFRRELAEFPMGTRAEGLAEYATSFGPLVTLREQLAPERWTALEDDLGAMLERRSPTGRERITYSGEYLVTEARRAR
jgi:SAM-dependent methyltransferase